MTVYAVIAYRTTMYAEILDALFLNKERAEQHRATVQSHLDKIGIKHVVKVEVMPVDEGDPLPLDEEDYK
jgi:hypothetical protein